MSIPTKNSFQSIYNPVSDIENILVHVHECLLSDPLKLNLLCFGFKEDIPKSKEFAELLFLELIHYCIPKSKLNDAKERARKNGKDDARLYMDLFREARNSFMKYKDVNSLKIKDGESENEFEKRKRNVNNRYGEAGELISYCIAIHYLKAAQLVSKMALKTSSEMPVFGLDGIHAVVGNDNTLTVYYLESKMTREYSGGVKQFSKSVSGFEKDRKGRLNEYRIIRDLSNLDSLEGQEKDKAINYFDPYSNDASNIRERFVGVISYNEPIYQDKIPVDDSKPLSIHFDNFKGKYLLTLNEKLNFLETELKKSGATTNKCQVFVLAMPDVDELKKDFAKELSGEHIS